MEIIEGELFIPFGKFSSDMDRRIVWDLANFGRKRRNGFALTLKYHEDEGVFLNPMPYDMAETILHTLKPKVLITIESNEYVMGVAGKPLKTTHLMIPFTPISSGYWIVEKFIRMEYDDFSYRIFKHSMEHTSKVGLYNFELKEKMLFESNWTGYPKNVVLKKMVEKIEGMLIARDSD